MSAYRQSPFANLTPVVKNLLIINLICFIPFVILSDDAYQRLIVENLGVFYFNAPKFRAWQIITYMFLHGGWTHILFNMFALFSFGPILEYAIGPKRFLNLYFICGIGAILFQWLVQAYEVHAITGGITIPFHFGPDDLSVPLKIREIYHVPLVGASGAIFGVLVAFAMLYPNLELMIMFIPVPIKAKYIIPVYIIIEIFLGVGQFGGDNVAHFAHLGGALLGFILVKFWRLR
ncbi:rhomboid-like protein [Mucilaginibacter frigoritolerans]|jgi:membrane associated rhomboid family serine protease|uniref:Rhomboid-like protein n=1 Tax=Mucilaginibacter frigoritolerans TaxID=652788 RepID=A0A562U0J5_9SPHI|nr:rhomboid family intramembrane serine protease [Mucilaginibacter frigoritolerans]TWI99382.1 rhomboid-like protein [Mucilaginibacter frigoritolerans]